MTYNMPNPASHQPIAEILIQDNTCGTLSQYGQLLFASQTVKVGRDPKINDICFPHVAVSRTHLEIYSIIFEDTSMFQPSIYVRDLQSFNGTFVNGHRLGNEPSNSSAILLDNGDTIVIEPFWSLRLRQFSTPESMLGLSPTQHDDAALFRDRYIVTDRILGQGHFAKIHLSTEVKSSRQVVCKIHNLDSLQKRDPSSVARVLQEVSILSQLDHPNVLAFRGAFQSPHSLYTFTELATGGDLFSLLERAQDLKELEIKWILRQVLSGLVYLHSKGVAHRDIKPENILCMTGPAVGHRIALSDFDCAGVSSKGRMISNVGTYLYKPPECRTPDQVHDLSVDIYAVGLLAVQLLAGNRDVLERFLELKHLEIFLFEIIADRTRGGADSIHKHGEDFIRGCLDKDPSKRFTAAAAHKHQWLTKPENHRHVFEQREIETNKVWQHRQIVLPVIQELPTRSGTYMTEPRTHHVPDKSSHFIPRDTEIVPQTSRTKSQRKMGMRGPSSYVGLDKHLRIGKRNGRPAVLDALRGHSSKFLDSLSTHAKKGASSSESLKRALTTTTYTSGGRSNETG